MYDSSCFSMRHMINIQCTKEYVITNRIIWIIVTQHPHTNQLLTGKRGKHGIERFPYRVRLYILISVCLYIVCRLLTLIILLFVYCRPDLRQQDRTYLNNKGTKSTLPQGLFIGLLQCDSRYCFYVCMYKWVYVCINKYKPLTKYSDCDSWATIIRKLEFFTNYIQYTS